MINSLPFSLSQTIYPYRNAGAFIPSELNNIKKITLFQTGVELNPFNPISCTAHVPQPNIISPQLESRCLQAARVKYLGLWKKISAEGL